jgi:hypothetical protein
MAIKYIKAHAATSPKSQQTPPHHPPPKILRAFLEDKASTEIIADIEFQAPQRFPRAAIGVAKI